MTNTFIEPGTWKKEDLFKDVDDGIYACEGIGGQTQMEMFTFTASYGYVIKNGQIQDLVRDVMVTGNVFETLGNIDAIADDLVLFKNSGGCGKGGQSPLPVSDGGPHIRVRNAVIA
jgi:TldD protein